MASTRVVALTVARCLVEVERFRTAGVIRGRGPAVDHCAVGQAGPPCDRQGGAVRGVEFHGAAMAARQPDGVAVRRNVHAQDPLMLRRREPRQHRVVGGHQRKGRARKRSAGADHGAATHWRCTL